MSSTTIGRYKITFYRTPFPGNCGIDIIHDVTFTIKDGEWSKETIKERKVMYKEFMRYIVHRSRSDEDSGEHLKLIMSDAVGGEMNHLTRSTWPNRWPSVYEFCKVNRWRCGKATYNVNSGNRIVVFEKEV